MDNVYSCPDCLRGCRPISYCVLVLSIAFLIVTPCRADIFVKRLPDGTRCFSNRPNDQNWKLYAREKPLGHDVMLRKKAWLEDIVYGIATRHGLDPKLVKSIIEVESGCNPRALSSKGAMGLMQLMPDTAKEMGITDPWDPRENVKGGTKYLSLLLKRYRGDLVKALAAYNAGPTAVDEYNGIPPYQETKEYVNSVMAKVNGGGR